jgi:hypothetical protein
MANKLDEAINTLGGAAVYIPDGFEQVKLELALSKENDLLVGEYIGKGIAITMNGKEVQRYKFRGADGKDLPLVLGSAQIDQFLDLVKVGDIVYIKRGKQGKSGKGKLNEYTFAVKRK